MTLFAACFENDQFLMSSLDYANTAYEIKLFSNFVMEWSYLVPEVKQRQKEPSPSKIHK